MKHSVYQNIIRTKLVLSCLIFFLCLNGLRAQTSGDFSYSENGNGTVTITRYNGGSVAVTIPGTINGEPVTAIGTSAFNGKPVTSVTIPNTVTSIGQNAFNGSALTSIDIPGSVTAIGPEAFYDCTKLSSLTLEPGITSIEEGAFAVCSSLTSVDIPASVTTIGSGAFGFTSTSNTSAHFEGNAPTSISQYAFPSWKFTLYYNLGAIGFTTPTWDGYPTLVYGSPSITTQPYSQTGKLTGAFSVVASGTSPLAYQWQESADGGSTWNNLSDDNVFSGSSTANLTFNATSAMNGCKRSTWTW